MKKQQQGFSLLEILVSLFVVMVIMLGVYNLVLLYLQISNNNKMYVIAIELVNQKMEQIRNMSYDDVGVIGGIPPGVIPQTEIVERGGRFWINTYVQFYDDPADGQIGSTTMPDTIPNDYKIATVKARWQSKNGMKSVSVFSKIIPRTVETFQGYGLLKISVRDSYAKPVKNASVRVVNNAVTPVIDVINLTNINGFLYLPATSSFEAYEITVTKTDEEPAVYWGRDQTYSASSGKAPRHLTVTAGNMTEEEFQIDRLANLRIRTLSTNLPENFQVNLTKDGRQEFRPRSAADDSGNIYFVWQADNATSSLVYAAKYNSAGSRVWANDKTVYSSLTQGYPDIAAAAAGDVYIVWQDSSVALKAITLAPGQTRLAKTEAPINLNQEFQGETAKVARKEYQSFIKILQKQANNLLRFSNKIAVGLKKTVLRLKDWRQSALVFLVNLNPFKNHEAKASATIVQALKISANHNNTSSFYLDFDNPPTAGNLLVAVAIHRTSNRSFNAPTNSAGAFTPSAYSDTSNALDVGIWHKIAGPNEPRRVTITTNGNVSGARLMLMEISGIDPTAPLNVNRTNYQGDSSRTATTNFTSVSVDSGFAVAALAFANSGYGNSPIWTSGSGDSWVQRTWTQTTSSGVNNAIGVGTLDVTAAAQQMATLQASGGTATIRNSVIAVYKLFDPDDVRVEAIGSQRDNVLRGQASQYLGGSFAISDLTGTHNITRITITENGTVDARNNLKNIKLLYDLDTTAPYDCAGESYSGSESQFGLTAIDGFSAADGTVTMNGNIAINMAQTMCVYVVADIGAGAGKNETIEIQISNPAVEVAINNGTVIPQTSVALAGATKIFIPAAIHQGAYRWRSDVGDEDEAFWLAGQNTGILLRVGERARLRFRLDNTGSIAASSTYRLEYGRKITNCASISAGNWTALPANDLSDWRSTSSQYYLDGEATTRQLSGGGEFIAGEIRKDNNQTSVLSLGGDQTTEIEFALTPTVNAGDYVYCFRLTDAGSALDFYDIYAEANIFGDSNVYITRLNSAGSQVWTEVKRVNNNDSMANQIKPRLALTEKSGKATTVVVWMDDRNGQYDIYAQSFDEDGNALWNGGDEIPITASSSNELEPAVTIDSDDNIIFAWTEEGMPDLIYMIKYDLTGSPVWPAPISHSSLFAVSQPSLAADGSGNFYLGYTENAGGNLRSYLAKYSSGGLMIWEKSVNLDAVGGERYSPAIAIRGLNLYAVWTDTRDNKQDIYGQKFNLNGDLIWPRDLLLNITIAASSSTQPALVVNSLDQPFAAWSDSRRSLLAVYAAEMREPGAIINVPNVNLHIWGTNTISETPRIFEWDLFRTTNSSGQLDIRVEADAGGYWVEATSTNIILVDPPMPLPLLPAQDQIWNIYIK